MQKKRAPGLVGQAFDFPAVCQNDLLNHGQSQPGALLIGREVGFENFLPAFGRNSGTVVTHFKDASDALTFPVTICIRPFSSTA